MLFYNIKDQRKVTYRFQIQYSTLKHESVIESVICYRRGIIGCGFALIVTKYSSIGVVDHVRQIPTIIVANSPAFCGRLPHFEEWTMFFCKGDPYTIYKYD